VLELLERVQEVTLVPDECAVQHLVPEVCTQRSMIELPRIVNYT
jgi:hypothetical protein